MTDPDVIEVTLSTSDGRLDRALADALPDLSRARVQALMGEGAITRDGAAVTDASAKAAPGVYRLENLLEVFLFLGGAGFRAE